MVTTNSHFDQEFFISTPGLFTAGRNNPCTQEEMFRWIACAVLFCMTASIAQSQNDSVVLQDRGYVLSVDVDLVTVAATVTDESGKYVNDLQARDFQLLEDGQEQKVSFFSHDAEVPVSL